MTILDRYIMRAILTTVTLVMAVLLILSALLTFIGEQDDIGVGNYTTLQAFWFVLLNLPQQAWELLPIGALIGALTGLGSVARGSELTVIRATGVSTARIAGAALLAAGLLIAIEVVLGEFLASPLLQAARQQKAFSKFTNVSFGGGGGAWVRDGSLILNVTEQSGERQFGGMLIFELSPEHRLSAVGRAARATAGPDQKWLLTDYSESRFTHDRVIARSAGKRTLESRVSADFLGLAVSDPRRLEVFTLWQLIRYSQANQLDARPYLFAFWSRIARTAAIAFAVLLSVPLALGSLRSARTGTRSVVGLLVGVALFLMQRLIESGTIVFNLNPVIVAWLPTAMLAVVSLVLLARVR